MVYDICVVGSGPSGAILVNLLQNSGFKIALVEKREFDKNYRFESKNLKSCGGLLSPDAQYMLAKLDLNLPKNILVDPQIFYVKTIDFELDMVRNYQRFYLNINREKFDRWLCSTIDKNKVDTFYSTKVTKLKKDGNIHKIGLVDEFNNKKEIQSKLLIGADGAVSVVRKLFKKSNFTKYASLQKVYKKSDLNPHFLSVFDSTITDYYGWGLVKDDYFYLGLATRFKEDARDRFSKMEKKLEKYGYTLGEVVREEGTLIVRPKTSEVQTVTDDGLTYLIGEAGGFISPSSAEGLSFAIQSAMVLAKAILEVNNISDSQGIKKAYNKKSAKIKRRVAIKNIKSKLLYNKYFRKAVMGLNISAIK